jgi:hypothetical protein
VTTADTATSIWRLVDYNVERRPAFRPYRLTALDMGLSARGGVVGTLSHCTDIPAGATSVNWQALEQHEFSTLDAALAWAQRVKAFLVREHGWIEMPDQEDVTAWLSELQNRGQ